MTLQPSFEVTPKRKVARSNRAGRAILSTVIVCELVSVGWKDGVTCIHTWAIVKWGSLPTAIPIAKLATTQLCLSGGLALSGMKNRERSSEFVPFPLKLPKIQGIANIRIEHTPHKG